MNDEHKANDLLQRMSDELNESNRPYNELPKEQQELILDLAAVAILHSVGTRVFTKDEIAMHFQWIV